MRLHIASCPPSCRPASQPGWGLILALAAAGPAAACDSCGCHAPPELGEARSGLRVGVFEQYTDFGTLNDNGREIDNPTGQWMHSSTTQVIASYRFADGYSASLFVPYISRSYKRPNLGVTEYGTVAGLGDMSLLGTARVYHYQAADSAFRAALQLGIKAPTGDSSQLRSERDGGGNQDPDNAVGGHDLALGTGSWDVLAGVNAIGRFERWYGVAQFFYAWHSQGDFQYQVANEFSLVGSIGYYLMMEAFSQVGVQINLDYESKGADTVAGVATDDTVNHNLFLGPEVNALWRGDWSGLVGVDIPLFSHNSEVQLVPTWRVRLAVGYRF